MSGNVVESSLESTPDAHGINAALCQLNTKKAEDRCAVWVGAEAAALCCDAVVGVFDGHGGAAISELLLHELLIQVEEALRKQNVSSMGNKERDGDDAEISDPWENVNSEHVVAPALDSAVCTAFQQLDKMSKTIHRCGGSTATVLFMKRGRTGTHVKAYWVGDSRGVIYQAGETRDVTTDHNMKNDSELKRIADLYGTTAESRHGPSLEKIHSKNEINQNGSTQNRMSEDDGNDVIVKPDQGFLNMVETSAIETSDGETSSREGSHHGAQYAKLAILAAENVESPSRQQKKPKPSASKSQQLLKYPVSFVGYYAEKETGRRMSNLRIYSSVGGASMNMTRSIGDTFAARGVICDPDVSSFFVARESAARFIVCSDGVWDVISSTRAGDLVSRCTRPCDAVKRLTSTAKGQRGYQGKTPDDITAVVVDVGAPVQARGRFFRCLLG